MPQPPQKRPRIDGQNSNPNVNYRVQEYVSETISKNLPTLEQYEEITIEQKLAAQSKQHSLMRDAILANRERHKKQSSVGLESEAFTFSRTLLIQPSGGFTKMKPVDSDLQYYLRRRANLPETDIRVVISINNCLSLVIHFFLSGGSAVFCISLRFLTPVFPAIPRIFQKQFKKKR